MQVLITGATGCVGANIAEAALRAGYEVRAMRRITSSLDALQGLEVDYATADVLDFDSVVQAVSGCDLVFHTAGVSQYWRNRPHRIYTVNVVGTRNVLRAAMACGVSRVVFTSSVAALGLPRGDGTLLDETATFDDPPERFHYGYSKVLAERHVQRAVDEGCDAVIVNPATVIGQRDIHFVGGEILRASVRGWTWAAPSGGMGVVGAKAVGEGHILAAERGRTGERYILNGDNLSHRELLVQVAEVVGGRRPSFVLPRAFVRGLSILLHGYESVGGPRLPLTSRHLNLSTATLYFDGSKAARELGFRAGSTADAIQEAWNWYQIQGMLP